MYVAHSVFASEASRPSAENRESFDKINKQNEAQDPNQSVASKMQCWHSLYWMLWTMHALV